MYFKNINLDNFRCFTNQSVDFSFPDGSNEGSGLNIFIGENGLGKTTIMEAISILTQSRLKTKGTIKVSDFQDIVKPIEIIGTTNNFQTDSVYGKTPIDCTGLTFTAKARTTTSQELIDPIVFDTVLNTNNSSSTVKPYELRTEVTKPWGASRLPSFEVIYLDNNRTRHLSSGMYSTKLDSVLDDFNSQVLSKIKSLDESDPAELAHKQDLLSINSQLLTKYGGLSDKLIKQVNSDFSSFFGGNINLDLINNFEPFSNSFLSYTPTSSNQQIPINRIGSGVEMLFSIFFLYRFYSLSGIPLIILIDEPELHLHPVWQIKLISFLKDISKGTQVFLSTHSPYIYKECLLNNVGLHIFKEDSNKKISISPAGSNYCNNFPWSPSWGEINYYGFNLPTVEFHNELYGFIQEKYFANSEPDMERYLVAKSIPTIKLYSRKDKNGAQSAQYSVTLPTYIRNQIHHPENRFNPPYTSSELDDSIKLLISAL